MTQPEPKNNRSDRSIMLRLQIAIELIKLTIWTTIKIVFEIVRSR
ncbi:hypothetical protein [Actinocorallia sp. API 0066]|nr:hypothetical protein [Actinocorallia sp. API 0066]